MARWWSGVFVVALLAVGAVTSSCSPTAPTPTRIISLSGNTTGELAELAFGDVQVGTSATATLTISNSGNSTLTWSIPSPPPGVGIVNFSGSPTSGTVAAGGSTSVTITFTPTEAIGASRIMCSAPGFLDWFDGIRIYAAAYTSHLSGALIVGA